MQRFFTLILLIFVFTNLSAQDIMTLQNGDEIKAKVIEIGTSEIKYKKFDNQNGPLYTILKNEVFRIKYSNGTMELIKSIPGSGVSSNTQNTGNYAGSNSPAASTPAPASINSGSGWAENLYYDANYAFNSFCILDQSTNKLKPMEKNASIPNYVPSFGWVPPLYIWEVEGNASSVRIPSGSNVSFIAKLVSPPVNAYKLRLVHFTSKDRKSGQPLVRRRASVMVNTHIKGGWEGWRKLNEYEFASTPDFLVPVNVTQLSNGIYEFKPQITLAPGEYGFCIDETFYTFGID